jgi:hypothetical protein
VTEVTGPPLTTDEEGDKLKKAEFEANMERERVAQNLPEGGVPEQRPQATISPAPVDGEVRKRLVEAGSPLAQNQEAMPKSAYDKASSKAQIDKAARESLGPERFWPGARAYVENPDGDGSEHHGRAVAINGVAEYADDQQELLAAAGVPGSRFAKVASYQCTTRDGRAENLIVSAEHLRRVATENFNKTET